MSPVGFRNKSNLCLNFSAFSILSSSFFSRRIFSFWIIWGQTHGDRGAAASIQVTLSQGYTLGLGLSFPCTSEVLWFPWRDVFYLLRSQWALPLEANSTLTSWIPVSHLRDCESFLFNHAPKFLIILYLNAWSSAGDQRDTALPLSPCLHLAPPLAASQHRDFLTCL